MSDHFGTLCIKGLKVEHLLHGGHVNLFKHKNYKVKFTLPQLQNNLRIFLNVTVELNLAGCYTTYFFKRVTSFTAIYCVKSVPLRISPYSVRMRENTEQNNSEYGHFLWSD